MHDDSLRTWPALCDYTGMPRTHFFGLVIINHVWEFWNSFDFLRQFVSLHFPFAAASCTSQCHPWWLQSSDHLSESFALENLQTRSGGFCNRSQCRFSRIFDTCCFIYWSMGLFISMSVTVIPCLPRDRSLSNGSQYDPALGLRPEPSMRCHQSVSTSGPHAALTEHSWARRGNCAQR